MGLFCALMIATGAKRIFLVTRKTEFSYLFVINGSNYLHIALLNFIM